MAETEAKKPAGKKLQPAELKRMQKQLERIIERIGSDPESDENYADLYKAHAALYRAKDCIQAAGESRAYAEVEA